MKYFVDSPRFPDTVAEGAAGGPTFKTSIFEGHSGVEQRSKLWRLPRHTYSVSLGVRTDDDMYEARDFFIQIRGRAVGFRFKDWNDYELTTTFTGTGAQTEFDIIKTYTTGAYTFDRRIYKPVQGTVQVSVEGTPLEEDTDFEVDYATGIITFDVAPTNGDEIEVTCEFDVPVRLDVDQMEAEHSGYQVQEWSTISLIELSYSADDYSAATSLGIGS